MISRIVFKNKYFFFGSDLVTNSTTLSKKNFGFPIVILPSAMDAACLTSSDSDEK